MVKTSRRCRAIIDQKNSFQVKMNTKIARALSAGVDMGRMILTRMPRELQPSIWAASSSSRGMLMKNCRRRNTPTGMAVTGRMIAHWVLRSRRSFMMK
jgi:hypothetical protein